MAFNIYDISMLEPDCAIMYNVLNINYPIMASVGKIRKRVVVRHFIITVCTITLFFVSLHAFCVFSCIVVCDFPGDCECDRYEQDETADLGAAAKADTYPQE